LKDREKKYKLAVKNKTKNRKSQSAGEPVQSSFAQAPDDGEKHPKSILKKKTQKQSVACHQVCQFCGASGHASADCPKYTDSDSEFFQDDCDADQSEPEYGYAYEPDSDFQCVGFGG
jgi:hypothetical protein